MKHILLLFTILVQSFSYSQTKPIKWEISRDSFGGSQKKECEVIPEEPLPKGSILDLYGTDSCKSLILCRFNNDNILVHSKFFINEELLLDSLKNINPKEKEQLEKSYNKFFIDLVDNFIKDQTLLLKKIERNGVAISSFNVYDESEHTDGTGFKFNLLNTGKKTIKYAWITIKGFNAVDDPVNEIFTGVTKTMKCIGPILPDNEGSYSKEYMWMTDIVEYAKLVSLKIQFMDGSIKTFSSSSGIILTKSEKILLGLTD